jgi:hypothetical protein
MEFIEEEYGEEGAEFAESYLNAIEEAQEKLGLN